MPSEPHGIGGKDGCVKSKVEWDAKGRVCGLALRDKTWNLYAAGVYQGKIRFAQGRVMWAAVDQRRRTQMQENVLPGSVPFTMPLADLGERLHEYEEARWQGKTVRLPAGSRYERHLVLSGTHQGRVIQTQVWAQRDASALDVVTLAEKPIAFVWPYRYGMEVLVQVGHEELTPLMVYDDPLLSQPLYGVNDMGTFLVAMRDGVQLATDVYLPEGVAPTQKLPAILVRTCYDRARNRAAFMRWANKGYAVVNQDVRGRADSHGELVPFYYERDDSSDTIDWIVEQDWSDGIVGMWGASYLGFVAVAAATSGNPHLKAVVDEVNVGSPWVDTVRRGGTVCSWPLLSWTLAQSVGTRTDFSIFAGETVNPKAAVDARPIRDIPSQLIGRRSGPWDLWSAHPDYDDFWRNCTFSERGSFVNTPMLVISGWYDGDSAGVSETWRMLTEHDVPHRKIWLGPWEHQPNRARDLMGISFSNDAVVYDYDVEVLRWFDRFLKGRAGPGRLAHRATYYVVGENRWRQSDNWPPVESVTSRWYLGSGGHANSRWGDGFLCGPDSVFQSPADSDSYCYDPDDPVDDGGERHPDNLRRLELRNDVLVYTSMPLTEDLTIAGELSAEIYAASTAVDTDWAVSLSDVDQAGNSIRLSHYIVRARYRHGPDKPRPLIPEKVERYRIFMPNLAYLFRVGHCLRFSITSSSKFVSFPNTNTGLNPYEDPSPLVARQTVYHTGQYPSHIQLPVLPTQGQSAGEHGRSEGAEISRDE
jgi:putative CocE/NonD family hydrolase